MEISHDGTMLISVSAEDIIDGVCREIPASVTHIGNGAFRDCRRLTELTIPAGVTHIGDAAFEGCTGLTGLTIPAGVTHIGDVAFAACRGLTGLTIPAGVTHIGDGVFYGCRGLAGLTIPAGVTHIGDFAFRDCRRLTELTIPAGVTHIGDFAFAGCTGLTELTLPAGVTHIGVGAFAGCTGLTELTIPAGVTHIGDRAFTRCRRLTELTIPAGVRHIGNGAFRECTGLTELTIPPGVTHIGHDAFEGCQALRAIIINGSEQEVRNIHVQLPEELRSRAISLERYNHVAEQIRQIRQEVLDSAELPSSFAELLGRFGELPVDLVKCINQFDERLHQAINREPLPAIDADLGDYKQRLEASLRVLAREHSIRVAIEKLETLIGSIRAARSTPETKHASGFFTSNLELAPAKIKVIEKLIGYLKGNVSEELSEADKGLIEQIGVIKTILGTHEISLADLLQIPAQGGWTFG